MAIYEDIRGKGLLFILLLWFLWFFNFFCRLTFAPLLPLIEDEFFISHAKASSIFTIAALGNAISLFTSGLFSGFFGYKRTILASLGLAATVLFLIPQTTQFSQLAFLLFLLGMSTGVYLPAVLPLITHHFDPASWGRAISIHDTGASLAVVCAPFAAVFLLKFLQWRQFFYVFGLIYILLAVLFALSSEELQIRRRPKGYLGDILKTRSLWIMAVVWMFAAGVFLALYYITPLYLTKELSLEMGHANTIFGFSRLGGACFALIMGFMINRISLKKSLFAIMFAAGVFVLFMGYPDVRVVQVALFLQGSIITGFFPVGLMAISRMFEKEARSLATGTITTLAAFLGAGLFPLLLGLAGDHLSFRFGILVLGICVTLSSGLVFFIKEID